MHAQNVAFDPGRWSTAAIDQQRRTLLIMANEIRIDSIYTEDIRTGAMELVVQQYPLARYEYHPDGSLFRRVDIRQQFVSDTTITEDTETGEIRVTMASGGIQDIPNGAYHEFFPNGNIRIKGTLDGYNADGTLKKTGEWMEWDANGNVIRKETYP